FVERLDHRGHVAPGAAIACERAVLVEARETRHADITAQVGRLGDLVDEFAERPERLQVRKMGRVFGVVPGSGREEVEPGFAERARGAQAGDRLDRFGEIDELVLGVGLPDPVGADIDELLELGHTEMRPRLVERGVRALIRRGVWWYGRPVCGRRVPPTGRWQFSKSSPAGYGEAMCRTSIND